MMKGANEYFAVNCVSKAFTRDHRRIVTLKNEITHPSVVMFILDGVHKLHDAARHREQGTSRSL